MSGKGWGQGRAPSRSFALDHRKGQGRVIVLCSSSGRRASGTSVCPPELHLMVSWSERCRPVVLQWCCYRISCLPPASPQDQRLKAGQTQTKRGHCSSAPSVEGGSWCGASFRHSWQTCGHNSHRRRASPPCGCGCEW